ncbi:TIGR00295 family protein [Candidatus Bathyarchaeota archaeon]|nr:TIGR00295 family protein [Candidatus Bathyarchaeota archaeon]
MSNHSLSYEEALNLLKKAGCSNSVIEHCIAVSKTAVEIAESCLRKGKKLDLETIKIGALLHDIGRAFTHDVKHGVMGAALAKSMNLPISIVRIIETHIGAGIPAEEAEELGLPKKDYMPLTLEEKIVCYADKLTKGNSRVDFSQALKDLTETLGKNHPALTRLNLLKEEILTSCSEI